MRLAINTVDDEETAEEVVQDAFDAVPGDQPDHAAYLALMPNQAQGVNVHTLIQQSPRAEGSGDPVISFSGFTTRRALVLVAVVALIAAIGFFTQYLGGAARRLGPATAASDIRGYDWTVDKVTEIGGTSRVPVSLNSHISFFGDRTFFASDGWSGLVGNYTTGDQTLTVKALSSAVGPLKYSKVQSRVAKALLQLTNRPATFRLIRGGSTIRIRTQTGSIECKHPTKLDH